MYVELMSCVHGVLPLLSQIYFSNECKLSVQIKLAKPKGLLESRRTLRMEFFRKNSSRLLAVNYFRKKKLYRRCLTGF